MKTLDALATSMTTEALTASARVLEQLAAVRAGGTVNMLDIRGVQVAADEGGLWALVLFCEDVLDLPRGQRGEVWMDALQARQLDSSR